MAASVCEQGIHSNNVLVISVHEDHCGKASIYQTLIVHAQFVSARLAFTTLSGHHLMVSKLFTDAQCTREGLLYQELVLNSETIQ